MSILSRLTRLVHFRNTPPSSFLRKCTPFAMHTNRLIFQKIAPYITEAVIPEEDFKQEDLAQLSIANTKPLVNVSESRQTINTINPYPNIKESENDLNTQIKDENTDEQNELENNAYINISTDEIMQEYAQKFNENTPLEEYNKVLHALRYQRASEHAFKVLEDMKIRQVTPNAKSYAYVFLSALQRFFAEELDSLITSGVIRLGSSGPQQPRDIKEKAAQLYLEAINEKGIVFGTELYVPLIWRCLNDSRDDFACLGYALCTITTANDIPISKTLYSSVMAQLIRFDRDNLAIKLFESIPQSLSDTFYMRINQIRALLKLGRPAEALELVDRFVPSFSQPNMALYMLIYTASKLQDPVLARSLFSRFSKFNITPESGTIGIFFDLAHRLSATKPAEAAEIVTEFQNEAQKLKLQPTSRYYYFLLRYYISKDIDKFLSTLNEAAQKNLVDVEILETCITVLGDLKIPSYTRVEMYTILSSFIREELPEDTFVSSIATLIDNRLLHMFSTIESSTTKISNKHSEPAYRAIFKYLIGTRQQPIAIDFMNHIITNRIRFVNSPAYIYNSTLEIACFLKNWEMASKIQSSMRFLGIRIRPYVLEKFNAFRQLQTAASPFATDSAKTPSYRTQTEAPSTSTERPSYYSRGYNQNYQASSPSPKSRASVGRMSNDANSDFF